MTPCPVLVTGASSGIGRAVALRLAARGIPVLAGVRQDADGCRLAEEATGRLCPLLLDITDPIHLAAAKQAMQELAPNGLGGLVNNAGTSLGGPLEHLPVHRLREHLEVNIVGHVAVTQICIDALRRATGRIVFVGSIGGRLSAPYLGPYSASKHALAALTDALRRELRADGMAVSLVEPGAVNTPIWDKAAEEVERTIADLPPAGRERYGRPIERVSRELEAARKRAVPPERVASAIEHALTARRPHTRYVIGADARIQAVLARFPDRVVDAVMAKRLG